ncbi:MAG: mechanosensitive ion channel family protein [Pseudomonadota bacterium]
MPDPAIPDSLYDVLTLAAMLVFAMTSLAAALASILVTRNNLLYLGTQLALLSLAMLASSDWAHPLWFADAIADEQDYNRIFAAALIAAIAFTCDMALKFLVWEGALARDGRPTVPRLLVGVVRVLVYLVAILIVVQFVLGQSITALAALSGAFALVLGLSAQSTLGEMFAGIAIALSRPFRVGDWVKIGNLDEGEVIDMTWRLVRIQTRDRNVLSVTNRVVADSPVQNFSHPSPVVRITDTICFGQDHDPSAVQELLARAMASAPGVLAEPPPAALFRGAKDGVAEYSLRYFIDDYQRKDSATEEVWKTIVEHIGRSNLRIALPARRIEVHGAGAPVVDEA